METKVENRVYYLDVLRFIACIAVVMIHTTSEYVLKDFGSADFWIGNILNSISRFGVPIFVMISGCLMLDKRYNCTNQKLIKHIRKMIVFFIFWSAIYVIFYQIIVPLLIKHEQINIVKIFLTFVKGHFHLWFIYMIIGLYLILPLLRLWVKDENKKYIEYFIILAIVFSFFLPQLVSVASNYTSVFKNINDIIDKVDLKYVGGYTTYFILGWYINNYGIKHKKMLYILGTISLAITIISTFILSITTGKAIQMYGNFNINVLLYSLMIFSLIKDVFYNKNGSNKMVSTISKYSLGIYAMHPLIIDVINKLLIKIDINMALINVPIVYILTLIISVSVSFLMSKIPILKNTV